MGRTAGFRLIFISPSRTCLPIHNRNRAAETDLHHEDRPGFHRAESQRPKHQQTKESVEQHSAGSGREFAATAFGNEVCAHAIETLRFEELSLGHEAEIVDPELTTDRTTFRQAPDAAAPADRQSAPVVNSPLADFQNPASFSSSLSYNIACVYAS